MAVGGALLQEPDPRDGGVRRRQGGRQRPGRQAVARRAPPRSPADHAPPRPENPPPPPAGAAAARGRAPDEAGAPPDRPPAAPLTARRPVDPSRRVCYGFGVNVVRAARRVRAPGKAVRIRRDPVTVIGDETHGRATGPFGSGPGRRGEEGDRKSTRL